MTTFANSPPPPPSSLAAKRSTLNLALLIANQFFGRIFTFLLNTLTVRHVGAIALGLASIHLYLIYSTILYIAREPFRRATLQAGFSLLISTPSSSQSNCSPLSPTQAADSPSSPLPPTSTTPSTLSIPSNTYQLALLSTLRSIFYTVMSLGIAASIVLSYIYIIYPPHFDEPLSTPSTPLTSFSTTLFSLTSISALKTISTYNCYVFSVIIFALSALLELSSEHLYLHTIRISNIPLRVSVEAIGNICRCVLTYATVVLFISLNVLSTGTALIAYSIGQFAFSAVVAVGYFAYYTLHITKESPHLYSNPSPRPTPQPPHPTLLFSSYSQLLPFLPQYGITNPFSLTTFDWRLTSWFKAYFVQSLIKHMLTEGEKVILVTFSPFSAEDNGSYVLVSNLGSLFVRIVLQPSEENQQQVFSEYHRDLQTLSTEIKDQMDELAKAINTNQHTKSATTQNSINSDTIIHEIHNNQQQTRRVTRSMTSNQSVDSISAANADHSESTQLDKLNHAIDLMTKFLCKKQALFQSLCFSLMLNLTLGLFLSIFGPPMAYSAVRVVYGEHWAENTTAPAVLALYSVSLVFFAINGITEGFLNTTLHTAQGVYHSNLIYVICSCIYFALLYFFTQYSTTSRDMFSTQGLVIANILTMSLRIGNAIAHILSYFNYSDKFQQIQDVLAPRCSDQSAQRYDPTNQQRQDNNNDTSDETTQIHSNSRHNALLLSKFADFKAEYQSTTLLESPLQQSQYVSAVTTMSDLTLPKLLFLTTPSRPLRFISFISLFSSHLIVTWLFYRQFWDSLGVNVFKMIVKSSQQFVSAAVSPYSPRTISQQGPGYIIDYVPHPIKQHFTAIALITPFCVLFLIAFMKFDFRRFQHQIELKPHNNKRD